MTAHTASGGAWRGRGLPQGCPLPNHNCKAGIQLPSFSIFTRKSHCVHKGPQRCEWDLVQGGMKASFLHCLSSLSCCYENTLDHSSLRENGFIPAQFRLESVMVGKPQWQESGWAGHIAQEVMKKGMNKSHCCLLPFPTYTAQDPSQGMMPPMVGEFPTSTNTITIISHR